MKGNKIGVLFLASVLALAGIGVAYAGFTDEIKVYGTVETATVEIDWIGAYSGTFVWKIWGCEYGGEQYPGLTIDCDNEIAIYQGFYDADTITTIETFLSDFCTYEFVSKSYAAESDSPDFDIKMIYDNLFPCIDFEADFIFHYDGSIPAKIDVAEIFPITGIDFLTYLWDYPVPGFGAWVEAYRAYPIPADYETYDEITGWDFGEQVDVGYQLHQCDFVYVKLTIHLPQENDLQGLEGTFGGKIGVIQWNEYLNDDCGPIIE